MKTNMLPIATWLIVIFFCVTSFHNASALELARELLEVPKEDAKKVEPIELVSVTLEPEQKKMLLKFTDRAEGIDLNDAAVTVSFYIQTPKGLKQVYFDPSIDGIKWEAPDANNKLNRLTLSPLGQFELVKIELHYKDEFKGSWTYKNKEKQQNKP